MTHERYEHLRPSRHPASLRNSLVSDGIEVSLRLGKHFDHSADESFIPTTRWCTEDQGKLRVANRYGSWQRQDTIPHILVASPTEGRRTTHIAHIVTSMVKHPQQSPVRSKPLITGSKARTHLEHRASVLPGNVAPVLYTQGVSPQPPLHTLGATEALE